MLKTRKRWISLLVTLAMLVTFAVPFVGPAVASTGIKALTVPNVSDGAWQNVGDVVIEVDSGALAAGDSLTLTLPDDYKFVEDADDYTVSESTYAVQITDTSADGEGDIRIETPTSYAGNTNELTADMLDVSILSEDQIQIQVKDPYNPIANADEAIIKVVLNKIWIKDGASGDVVLTVDKPSDSAFPSGDVVIARVPGGKCELSVPSIETISDTKVVKFRVKETTTGSLEEDAESLKLSLPNGFEWAKLDSGDYGSGYNLLTGGAGYVAAKKIWGDTITLKDEINSDKDELTFNVTGESSDKAAYYEFIAKVTVADESKAEAGDIVVDVGGESDVSVDSFVIATYGEYNTKISADDPETEIFAGMLDQDVSDLTIKEDVAGSLIENRTIILTLPDNAKWTQVDENGDSDNNCILDFVGPVGDEGRSIKYKVERSSSADAAELTLEDFQVAVEPGFTGDLKVEVSGTAGLEGEVVIAKVKTPVTITASTVNDMKIGLSGQPVGDVTITETAAGALKEDAYVKLDLPDGVSFSSLPTVEVVNGNLGIDTSTVKRAADGNYSNNQLWFKISNDSSKASTIKVSNIKLTVDRTVPEGDILIKVKGPAAAETADPTAIEDYFNDSFGGDKLTVEFDSKEAYTLDKSDLFFPNTTTAAQTVLAKVVTPAPVEQKGTAVFKIGEAKYTLNGTEITMDAAPYIKDGRTMVPVRFAANAVGVADSNIIWDAASKKVTVIKGDRVVQMTIGSNVMLINGAAIVMDTAPEISSDRTMLPVRFLGQALGADFVWDAAAQTVTVNF